MRTRSIFVSALLTAALVIGGLAVPSQAGKKLEGSLSTPQVPAWLGLFASRTGMGSDTVTAAAFADACQQDREAYAAGDEEGATHIAAFLESDENGLDAYVFDLGKEVNGAFFAEGPGTTEYVPDVTGMNLGVRNYDLDIDFFTGAEVDAADYDPLEGGLGCPNANRVTSSHKCYAHKPDSHEKAGCVAGYTDAKKVKHFARYVMVSGSLNLNGPMPVFLTTP